MCINKLCAYTRVLINVVLITRVSINTHYHYLFAVDFSHVKNPVQCYQNLNSLSSNFLVLCFNTSDL